MIDARLFQLTEKKNLFKIVIARLLYLCLSIIMWLTIAYQLDDYLQSGSIASLQQLGAVLSTLGLKILLTHWLEKLTYQASAELRLAMRNSVMEKAFRLGKNQQQLSFAILAQLSVAGIEQLEIYYARFLPQLVYCLFASLLIFGTLVGFAWRPAVVLLVCMPLIPFVIMNVSDGERQRLGLARLFLHDAPFLLLDEPTSNLDYLNEQIILSSLTKETTAKAVLLISHRDTTLAIAQQRYLLAKGYLHAGN